MQNKRCPQLAQITQGCRFAHREKLFQLVVEAFKGVYSSVLFKATTKYCIQQENDMKARMLLLTLALYFAGTALSFAQSPQMGTWKLDESKSKIPAGLVKNSTVIYATDGDKIKVTTDGTGGDGKPMHTEWTGKFDGKEYPLTGDRTADSRSYKMIDEHTLDLTSKKGGNMTNSGHVVVSADGKTRTLHMNATDASGKKVSGISIYTKQ
jgi:hypothetical protein